MAETDVSHDASQPGCNGHVDLCSRRFDEVIFPGTHNSMSNADDGWFNPNQPHPMTRQLQDGIRAMLLDTHYWMKDAYLCHGFCGSGNKSLVEALREIRQFLEQNPTEVIALLLEDHVSSEDTVAAFDESGLSSRTFTRDAAGLWPTLAELIEVDRRVFVAAQNDGPPPDWYHNMWDVLWDTSYSQEEVSKLSCDFNRGNIENPLLLLNHWLGGADSRPERAATANQYSVLHERTQQCLEEMGRLPNFIAVDYYTVGDLFQVVNELNGV